MTRRIVLVAELDPQWAGIAAALESDGLEIDVLSPRTTPADVVACAARAQAVVIVDLTSDPGAGVATVAGCRRSTDVGPVVAVAANPSLDLARAIRVAGAFYLALQPASVDEIRSAVQSAFDSMARRRTAASVCHATRRVLIIDDDDDFVASTAALLEAQGYAVTTARNGREGLSRAAAEHPDLIVLDVVMENDSAGYEVNELFKFSPEYENLRHVPILMVSSISNDPSTRFCRSEELDMITPNAYLTKPLNIPRFLGEVAALLGEPALSGTRG